MEVPSWFVGSTTNFFAQHNSTSFEHLIPNRIKFASVADFDRELTLRDR